MTKSFKILLSMICIPIGWLIAVIAFTTPLGNQTIGSIVFVFGFGLSFLSLIYLILNLIKK